jgi:hypothetical protein
VNLKTPTHEKFAGVVKVKAAGRLPGLLQRSLDFLIVVDACVNGV